MSDSTGRMVKFGHGYKVEAPVEEFGKKASVLAEMSALGIPIPPGFVLNVSVCEDYFRNSRQLSPDVPHLLRNGISFLEKTNGLSFGSERKPLLVSVRSGSAISMPGAMETVLNIGLNHDTVKGLIFQTGNPRFAWDSYRRLIESFGKTVFSHDPLNYSNLREEIMEKEGISEDNELDFISLKVLVRNYERVFQNLSGQKFPEDIYEQLDLVVRTVLDSWMGPKAQEFRKMESIENARGTAVTVQTMVFGNRDLHSGSGIAFTRNPWSGEDNFVTDFKFGVQGEDLVSGYRAGTKKIDMMDVLPDVYKDLVRFGKTLERHYMNMQDIEFTVQDEKLYILQSRDGKRSPLAALRIAVDMYRQGLLDSENALKQLKSVDLDNIVVQELISTSKPLGKGDSASLGVTTGMMAFSSEKAESFSKKGNVILVREMPSPDDIKGIKVSSGYLTARGARTAHASVVARQMGKVCIVNCADIHIDPDIGKCTIGNREFAEGEVISIDGNTGYVYEGEVEVRSERPLELLSVIDKWK
ncbi:MAG: pyruvate, orthophosphate dikinase [Methanolobus sp.]|uniref:PEP/pyruvate-binding domain-containing protein n=1 Tax=Methanolobus sp. TaxID=1874737 RepID=UPI00258FA944|nr:PEP/pyruvate-binding domain-containing protein [Methanolobus sp.]MDK2830272.1 pyruvate, orthophosphate dikinase [Methanolobus sp.]